MKKNILYLMVGITGLTVFTFFPARAEDETKANDSEVRIGVPLWASGANGTVGARGKEGRIDESFTDIADTLDFSAAMGIEVHKKRWYFFVSSFYLKTSTDIEPGSGLTTAVSAEFVQKQVEGDVGLGYSIYHKDPYCIDIFAGARFNYIDSELFVQFPASQVSFSESKFWVDPVIGIHAEYRFTPVLGLYAKADVGGFGVASDLTWQAEGGLDIRCTQHTYLRLAYRYLSTDYKDGGFRYNVDSGGPQLEFGLRF